MKWRVRVMKESKVMVMMKWRLRVINWNERLN